VQHILAYGAQSEVSKVIRSLAGYWAQLSMHKLASNVVEKCMQQGSPEESLSIIEELVEVNALTALVSDPYGNFVVQRLMDFASVQQIDNIQGLIEANKSYIQSLTHGRHVLGRLEHTLQVRGLRYMRPSLASE
jgi:pumilio RNA-binding family